MPVANKPGLAKGLPNGDEAPLRGKAVSKVLKEPRRSARLESAAAISDASEGVSNSALGAHFGGDLAGCQLRTGALVATAGEVALLAPLEVASLTLLRLLRMRYQRELDRLTSGDGQLRLRLAVTHVDAAMTCLAGVGDIVSEELRPTG